MPTFVSRVAAATVLRASQFRGALAFLLALLFVSAAQAVVVRGRVTNPLGAVVPGARVQLIQAGQSVGAAISDGDGAFEIRIGDAGRFTLLTSAGGYLPAVGEDFYGGASEIVAKDVTIAVNTVRQQVSVTATGIPTPLPQLTVPVTVIPGEDLATRFDITQEMRQTPGAFLVQTGQAGGVTSLFVRGGQSDANKVTIDGVPAEDIGGRFDFGTVSSTGVAGLELNRGPNSALYGSDALASVVSLATPRGIALEPVLNYSGDAGNLHTYRNEASVSGAYRKLDYYTAFSRFDTANAVANNKYHSATSSANLGYTLAERTLLRGTIRNAVSASGVPGAHDFFGISANAKEGDQDIYAQGTLDHRTLGGWHNLVRYGVARKREQFTTFSPVGTAVTAFGFTTYFGNIVKIRGANGYETSGQASIAFGGTYPQRYDQVSNRDELYYQTDYAITHHLTALFGFRYENERGAFRYPVFGSDQSLQRTNFQYTGQLQGDIRNRVFYSLGGAVEKNHLYGTRGTPRLGLAWVAVRPSDKTFRGTRLRFDVSRGVQEPSLNVEFSSLYRTLLSLGNTAAIAAYGVRPALAEEARTYDVGVDQNIFAKLVLKAGYFHSQFDHEYEFVSSGALRTYFGIAKPGCTPPASSACALANFFGAYTNSLTYRAQGMELEMQYQPTPRIFVRGGYTFLAPIVQRSFSTDALRVAGSTVNPLFPGVTIGSTSPLAGQRPFRRAPNTGFLAAQYTRPSFTVAFRGAFAGKSDDSTFLGGSTPSFDNSLLLPNRNLDFGYAKLDLSGTYRVTSHVVAFTQLENLMNNQHIGPIGFPGLPLTVRAGLKVRIGGD